MKAVQVSRRDFLKVSGMAGAGLALASCTAVVPETGTEAAPQEVTVFFWDGPPLIGIREEALAPFDEAYPGCELNFTSVPGGWNAGYSEKLYAGLAANDPPDLFIIRIADLPEFLSKDLLLDLKPYVDRDSYDLNEFPALAIESYTHDGGIYGMPDNVASVAMFCNQDMIEEAGAQVPTNQWDDPGWTVDDFFNMCEAVTQRDANGDTTQYAYQVTGWSVIWQIWVRIFGGQLVDDPFYPTECTLNEPGAVEGLQFYADLIHKYGFAPRFDVMQDLGAVELMHTGRLAIINNGSWSFPNFHDVDYEVTLGHYPSGPGGRANYVYYFPAGDPQDHPGPGLCLEPAEVLQWSRHGKDHPGRGSAGHDPVRTAGVLPHRHSSAPEQAGDGGRGAQLCGSGSGAHQLQRGVAHHAGRGRSAAQWRGAGRQGRGGPDQGSG